MTAQALMKRLNSRAQRGSKPRCHWLTYGARGQVGHRLTELAQPWGTVSAADCWLPEGFDRLDEARLDREPGLLPEAKHREALRDWWLAVSNGNTPNFDIVSTCKVGCKRGLLLVEAKAHASELTKQKAKKPLKAQARLNSRRNHKRIGAAIEEANAALRADTGLCWKLSRDRCYQMSNRFAWSWKLTTLGYPVILVYLGFLNAREMCDQGTPFANDDKWQSLVKEHSRSLFPEQVWDQPVPGRAAFVPCIHSRELRHDAPMADG